MLTPTTSQCSSRVCMGKARNPRLSGHDDNNKNSESCQVVQLAQVITSRGASVQPYPPPISPVPEGRPRVLLHLAGKSSKRFFLSLRNHRHQEEVVPTPLHEDAPSLLFLRQPNAGDVRAGTAKRYAVCASVCHLRLEGFPVVGDDGQDGPLKDLLDALHLLTAALHILRAHLLRDGQALLRRYRREALRLEHVDARLLVAQIRLEADEDERCVWAEVEDFGVPLFPGFSWD